MKPQQSQALLHGLALKRKDRTETAEQFLAELDREGITVDELRETYALDLLKARLINQITRERVNLITDNDVENFYNDPKNKQFFTIPASVQLTQIFIPVPEDVSYKEAIEIKKQSEEIYKLAKNGQSFTELVKLHSMSSNKEENLGFLGSFAAILMLQSLFGR